MEPNGNRLTSTLESHPRLTAALFTTLTLLTVGVTTVAADSGVNVGP